MFRVLGRRARIAAVASAAVATASYVALKPVSAQNSTLQGNVLITGAASGIGRLMALRIAREGGNIVACDIHQGNLDKLVNELQATTGRKHHGYICDVSNRDKVYECAEKIKKDVGDIDVLINNAGIVSGKRFLDLPDNRIELTLKVNTLSMFWTTKAFLPAMIEKNRGHVVTVASAAGLIGVCGLSDYSASKFAAVGFDESLRVELKRIAPGVKTTLVCPFYIDTGLFEGVSSRFPLLLPILKQEDAANRIVDAIAAQKPRLIMPSTVFLMCDD